MRVGDIVEVNTKHGGKRIGLIIEYDPCTGYRVYSPDHLLDIRAWLCDMKLVK